MSSLLEIQNLQVAYDSRAGGNCPALSGLNFDVQSNEILGILGESGSGKSTLAASLLSLLSPNAHIRQGRILLGGRDLLEMDSRELQQLRGKCISLIAQEPSLALHPTMRIADQVGEVLLAHGIRNKTVRHERVAEVLRSVFPTGADHIASRYPHELSGGQRQRVLMAQAIACKPALLVADEPTASLDSATQREILALFKQLQRDLGLAIIFITHNPALLLGFADRILVLYAGKIVECGPTENVLFASQHPYTRALLQCVPDFDVSELLGNKGMLPVIPGVAPNLEILSPGCVFEPRCPDRMEVCRTGEPASVAVADNHQAACFKLSE